MIKMNTSPIFSLSASQREETVGAKEMKTERSRFPRDECQLTRFNIISKGTSFTVLGSLCRMCWRKHGLS